MTAVCLFSLLIWFAYLYRPQDEWKDKEKSPRDTSTLGPYMKWIHLAIILIVVASIIKGVDSRGLALGYAISFLAMTLIHWAKKNLGVNFSDNAASHVPKEVVRTGPYAYVRHPIYVGNLLFFLGLSVATQSALMMFIVLALAHFYNQSAQNEEMELVDQFPDYTDYIMHTGRFIPRKFTR